MRVVVIGAGLVGLATAWTLHRGGAEVTVVDPAPGQGATYAAAGMLAAVTETYYREEELGRLCLAGATAYPAFVEDVAEALGRGTEELGHRTTPTLVVGADAADREALTDLHRLSTGLGLASQLLTTREARRREPLLSPRISCAVLAEGDHQVDPRTLGSALLEALTAARAEAHVPARASGILHSGDPSAPVRGVRLEDGTTLEADAVVVANAVAAKDLEGLGADLTGALRPVYGDVLRLRPPARTDQVLAGSVRGRVAGRPVYLVPRADGSVVLGATSREDGRAGVHVGGLHELLSDAIRIVPALAECELAEVVARPRPGTPDNAPLLGRLPTEGLVVATGTYRNGILLAPAIAAAVTRLLGLTDAVTADALPELPDLTPFDPLRFRPATHHHATHRHAIDHHATDHHATDQPATIPEEDPR